ncbi:MAG: 2-amino-4-hydroxy-6-hydroxymethyldihydropteridine diphosphokinase [Candidatus Endonucleobacter bathymodioli]|uniref:2-amino-4-hydroxy-6-hydroxymethyldihydropteridine pyrophosphokinase n=1 Tax=Candidatus Endonucleibacter bathymodioli TaxID=539814 RepID=A0AA90SY35_9GAMM|nr:2-amino-4-hydroxy-6-hydroxymethyldihydropteridine diphosphokinase [Candidatus Endonucleobacter bathymodioli]
MAITTTSYIALGSNLGNSGHQLQRAVDDMASEKSINLLRCSKLYRSSPIGPSGQQDYYNAVIAVSTDLSPESLLDTLQSIEYKYGRIRTVRWGPRTLDLDILLYGDQTINTSRLTIPHYQLHLRPFTLYPLNDIASDLIVPGHGCLFSLLDNISSAELNIVADSWPWL